MTLQRRFIIGKRSDGSRGVFIGPPGVDPDTATSTQLTLHVSNKVDQIIMQGQVASLPATVVLGLTGYAPWVLIQTFAGVPGQSAGLTLPYGNYWDGRRAMATVTASSLTLQGASPHCYFIVFNKPAP